MGIEELIEYSLSGVQNKEKMSVLDLLQKNLDGFFWDLNNDKEYEKEAYGGKKEKGFHPSAIVDIKCPRKLVYDWLEMPISDGDNDINPKLRRIFDNGHDLHDRWQKYFTMLSRKCKDIELIGDWKCKACEKSFSKNKEVPEPDSKIKCKKCGNSRWKYNEFKVHKKSLYLTGKRDGKLIIKGEPYLLEIKSINTFQFKKLFTPLESHKKQFCFYMLMDGTKKGLFLYEDKNTQDYKFLYFEYDSNLIENEINILTNVSKAIDEESLPDRLLDYSTCDTCKLCVYRKICKENKSYIELKNK